MPKNIIKYKCVACRDTGHVLVIKKVGGKPYEYDYACNCNSGKHLVYDGELISNNRIHYTRPCITKYYDDQQIKI